MVTCEGACLEGVSIKGALAEDTGPVVVGCSEFLYELDGVRIELQWDWNTGLRILRVRRAEGAVLALDIQA